MTASTHIQKLDQVLYTAHAHTTGGREGRSVSDDGLLDVTLAPPKELGGKGGATNPEQLFAAGYSACFMGAMKHVASMKKISVPADGILFACEICIHQFSKSGYGFDVFAVRKCWIHDREGSVCFDFGTDLQSQPKVNKSNKLVAIKVLC